jgi:hypothetical protein
VPGAAATTTVSHPSPLRDQGVASLRAGAAVVHARRKETPLIAVNVVLLVLAAVVAWGRFGPYAF